MEAPNELVEYVRNALEKKYPAVVIRSALKKAGHSDATVSSAFAQVKAQREKEMPRPAPKKMPPKLAPKKVSPKPTPEAVPAPPQMEEAGEELALEDMDIPPEPEGEPPEPPSAQQRKIHVRHVIVAALFLIAVILMMYAVLAPILLRVS